VNVGAGSVSTTDIGVDVLKILRTVVKPRAVAAQDIDVL
jgi:hypothetical protein